MAASMQVSRMMTNLIHVSPVGKRAKSGPIFQYRSGLPTSNPKRKRS